MSSSHQLPATWGRRLWLRKIRAPPSQLDPERGDAESSPYGWASFLSPTASWKFCSRRSDGCFPILPSLVGFLIRWQVCEVAPFFPPSLGFGSVFSANVVWVLLTSLSVCAPCAAPADSCVTRCSCIIYLWLLHPQGPRNHVPYLSLKEAILVSMGVRTVEFLPSPAPWLFPLIGRS